MEIRQENIYLSEGFKKDLPLVKKRFKEWIEGGISPSSLELFSICKKKWFHTYIQRLEPVGTSKHLVLGSLLHKYVEQWVEKKEISQIKEFDLLEELESDVDKFWASELAFAMARTLPRVLPELEKDLKVNAENYQAEIEMELEIYNLKLKGIVDLIDTKNHILYDYKTRSRIDMEEVKQVEELNLQYDFYSWMYWKITGCVPQKFTIIYLKKPSLRARKDDSEFDAVTRGIQSFLLDRDKHFYVQNIEITEERLQSFEENVLASKFATLQFILNWAVSPPSGNREEDEEEDLFFTSLLSDKNLSNCNNMGYLCPFIPLCTLYFDEASLKGLYKLRTRN